MQRRRAVSTTCGVDVRRAGTWGALRVVSDFRVVSEWGAGGGAAGGELKCKNEVGLRAIAGASMESKKKTAVGIILLRKVHGETRTRNLLLRREAPYPLGHADLGTVLSSKGVTTTLVGDHSSRVLQLTQRWRSVSVSMSWHSCPDTHAVTHAVTHAHVPAYALRRSEEGREKRALRASARRCDGVTL